MKKRTANVKAPDLEKDRKQIVKETKRDLDEMLKEPSPIGNLAELVKALKKAKKKNVKRRIDLRGKSACSFTSCRGRTGRLIRGELLSWSG